MAENSTNLMIPRRTLLRAAGAAAVTGPLLWSQAARAGAPAPEQLHLTFGADAATQMSVSWATPTRVARPRLRLGTRRDGYGSTIPARTRSYRDAATGRDVITHHVALSRLTPNTEHVYEVLHDGAPPHRGSFRTGPSGRAPFRFTSFGDQGVDDPSLRGGSTFSRRIVGHIEEQRPLLHLLNGDLVYANLNANPGGAWDAWMRMNEPSTRHRPWMPAAGNHENETGNGATGYNSFRTRYALPDNGLGRELTGHFYAFTVGSVRFVVLQNDDVCYQDGGNFYVRGYSGGAQKRWLDRTLAAARRDRGIDWVVVVMHQLVMSSAATGNGCDLGIRQEFAPLFDRYGVDLVLAGHDHDYERTHPVRGTEPGGLLTPKVADTRTDLVDTTKGTVHMTLGGGGSIPLNVYAGAGPAAMARVITGKSSNEIEPAAWSAVVDPVQAFGFASFDVDPGRLAGGQTTMRVTYYRTAQVAGGAPQPYETFTLTRPRSDRR